MDASAAAISILLSSAGLGDHTADPVIVDFERMRGSVGVESVYRVKKAFNAPLASTNSTEAQSASTKSWLESPQTG